MAGAVNFDVKARLEEKERKSQMVIVGFNLQLNTKPSIVKFEIEGTTTIMGKETEINRMLEVDPETKLPYVFKNISTHVNGYASTVNAFECSPPLVDLLLSGRETPLTEHVALEPETARDLGESASQAQP